MRIHDLTDTEGRVFAFEVSNIFLSRGTAGRIAGAIRGARLIREHRPFSWSSDDEFCEFELDGVAFVIWEPWGDNSRYWIGAKPPRWVPQIAQVREAFAHWQPFGTLRSWFARQRRRFQKSPA